MKKGDVRQWWHIIDTMSGRQKNQLQFTIERDGHLLSEADLVESLNEFFVSVASDIPPLDILNLPTFLPTVFPPPTVHPHEVCSKLVKLQTNKAMGPDNIPPRADIKRVC